MIPEARVRAIVNPNAGPAGQRAAAAVVLGRRGWDLDIVRTEAPGHATSLARDAAGAGIDLVLAVGGDGTISEVAAGLVSTRTAMGVVPGGSGNGFARTLGIPLDPRRALSALADGEIRPVDAGIAGGRTFVNVASVGFDAEVAGSFHDLGRLGGSRGKLPYVTQAFRLAARRRSLAARLEWDGGVHEAEALLVAAMNGRQYGSGAILAAGARLDDGLLDVVVIENRPLPALVAGAVLLYAGRLDRLPWARTLRTRRLVITAGEPLAFQRDGEPDPRISIAEFGIVPGALRVVVPRETLEDPEGPFTCSRR